MPASIQIVLTDEEDRTLSELRVATTVPAPATEHICYGSMLKDGPAIVLPSLNEHGANPTTMARQGLRDYGRLSGGVQNKK